ncbi:homeobox protein prospero-like, partial [Frankliniella occidentalis]|uniref:Homeobox protein prospero-like n=1 Tax=Frankliniella occidentalis TaxID=133901 RepID=A0A9C6XVV4_FRAOC
MMSSEEESKCLGLYGDKLKKRQRQRVDAGEPRNSYSSIPNFSSRPTFLCGSPYEQLFQPQSHIGFLGQGFAPGSAKMLNELLGRQVKGDPCALGVGAVGPADVDCYSNAGALGGAVGVMIRRGLVDEDHMLRDILQGRKKELLALEQELQGGEHDNNNTLASNNNDLLKNGASDSSDVSEVCVAGASGNKLLNGSDSLSSGPGAAVPDDALSRSPRGGVVPAADKQAVNVNGDASGNGAESDSDTSVHSTATTTDAKDVADDQDDDDDKKSNGSSGGMDLKRKRVENIVSTMARSSPLPQPVNGCKKRKLYHPQQHDAGLGVALGMQALMMDDQDEDAPPALRHKQSALKSQLRSLQGKLVEMQHEYVRLCSRMEQVETPEQDQDMDADPADDDDRSDIMKSEQRENDQDMGAEQDQDQDQDEDQDQDGDQDADNSLSLSDKTGKDDSSPPATPVKEASQAERTATSAPTTPSSATSPVVKQMAPPKIHPHHGNPMFPPHPMQLALLQQQHLAAGGDYHPHHP